MVPEKINKQELISVGKKLFSVFGLDSVSFVANIKKIKDTEIPASDVFLMHPEFKVMYMVFIQNQLLFTDPPQGVFYLTANAKKAVFMPDRGNLTKEDKLDFYRNIDAIYKSNFTEAKKRQAITSWVEQYVIKLKTLQRSMDKKDGFGGVPLLQQIILEDKVILTAAQKKALGAFFAHNEDLAVVPEENSGLIVEVAGLAYEGDRSKEAIERNIREGKIKADMFYVHSHLFWVKQALKLGGYSEDAILTNSEYVKIRDAYLNAYRTLLIARKDPKMSSQGRVDAFAAFIDGLHMLTVQFLTRDPVCKMYVNCAKYNQDFEVYKQITYPWTREERSSVSNQTSALQATYAMIYKSLLTSPVFGIVFPKIAKTDPRNYNNVVIDETEQVKGKNAANSEQSTTDSRENLKVETPVLPQDSEVKKNWEKLLLTTPLRSRTTSLSSYFESAQSASKKTRKNDSVEESRLTHEESLAQPSEHNISVSNSSELTSKVGQPPEVGQPLEVGQPPEVGQPLEVGQPPEVGQSLEVGQPPEVGQSPMSRGLLGFIALIAAPFWIPLRLAALLLSIIPDVRNEELPIWGITSFVRGMEYIDEMFLQEWRDIPVSVESEVTHGRSTDSDDAAEIPGLEDPISGFDADAVSMLAPNYPSETRGLDDSISEFDPDNCRPHSSASPANSEVKCNYSGIQYIPREKAGALD